MSFSLSADGTVRSKSALIEHAKKHGLCQVCGEVKTHERVKQRGIRGMLTEQKFSPITVQRDDGSYEVYKGYCLHPRCYTLKQAKRELGEDVVERRRSSATHHDHGLRTIQSHQTSTRQRPSLSRTTDADNIITANCTPAESSLLSSTMPGTNRLPLQPPRSEVTRSTRSPTGQSPLPLSYVPPAPLTSPALSSPASARSSRPSLSQSSISESPPQSPLHHGSYHVAVQSQSPIRSPTSTSTMSQRSLNSIVESSIASSSSSQASPGSSQPSRQSTIQDFHSNTFMDRIAIPDIHVERNPTNEATTASSSIGNETQMKLNEIKSLLEDLMQSGDVAFTLEMICNAMETNQKSALIQSFLLTSIRDLCNRDDNNKDVAMDDNSGLHLHKKIIHAMKSHAGESQVQEAACKCISALTKSPKHRRPFSQNQFCKYALQALEDHIDQQKVVSTVLDIILTFSTDTDFRSDFVALEGKSLVLQSMEAYRTCAEVQRNACVILSNFALTNDSDSTKVALISNRELQAVMDSINYNREDNALVFRACFALKNWTFRKENLKKLEELPGALALLQDVTAGIQDEKAQRTAAIVLERLVVQRTKTVSVEEEIREHCQNLESSTSVENITKLMQDHNLPHVIREGLQCLWLLANESAFQRDNIVDSGALHEIIGHMYRYKSNAEVQEKGCELLECLARGNETGRAAIIHAGGSKAIVNAIRNHGDSKDVQRVAFEALNELSTEFECWFDLEQDGSIDAVGKAFQKHAKRSAGVERSGSILLSNFSLFRSQNNITV